MALPQRRSAVRPLLAVATLLLVGGLLLALYFSQIELLAAEESRAAGSGGVRAYAGSGGAGTASRPYGADRGANATSSQTMGAGTASHPDGADRGTNATSSQTMGAGAASRPDPAGALGSATATIHRGANATSSHTTVTSTATTYEKEAKLKASRLERLYATKPPGHESPACRPHFQSVDDGASWEFSNATRFRRMAFHHARKAGGTSIADYLAKVAHHYGIEWAQTEFESAEEPGTADVPTFYVTHLREPVSAGSASLFVRLRVDY